MFQIPGHFGPKSSRFKTPFKQWHGRGICDDMFSAGLLLSVGQSSTLIVTIKCTCIHEVSQSEVYPESAGRIEKFFEGVQILQRMARLVNFT